MIFNKFAGLKIFGVVKNFVPRKTFHCGIYSG